MHIISALIENIRQHISEMFVRMLTVHCDQNNSYEITIKGPQVRKIISLLLVEFSSFLRIYHSYEKSKVKFVREEMRYLRACFRDRME